MINARKVICGKSMNVRLAAMDDRMHTHVGTGQIRTHLHKLKTFATPVCASVVGLQLPPSR